MKNEALKTIIQEYLQEIKSQTAFSYNSDLSYRYLDILNNARKLLPDNESYITKLILEYNQGYPIRTQFINDCLNYILRLISINYSTVVENKKILQDAEDKLLEAGISLEHEDFTSVINNLNTATELALKEEIDIPLTIRGIDTRNIIEICIAQEVGPKEFLQELIKHVLEIDNKIKHQGYKADQKDAINAISAFEGFLKRIKKTQFNVSEEIRQKIFAIKIIKNQ